MSRISLAWLRKEAVANRTRFSLALRVTIAALAGLLLARLLRVPMPLWAVLTAVVLTQVSFGKSVKATVDYFAGTLCGAAYSGVLGALIPHSTDLARAGLLAITVAPLALVAAFNPRFSAATFTGVLVLLLPTTTLTTPIEAALYRVFEVAVGGGVALIVSLLVLPTRSTSLATIVASEMLTLAANALPDLFAGFFDQRDFAEIARLQSQIGSALARLEVVAAEAKHERINFLTAQADSAPLLRTLLRLRHDLVMIGRAASTPLPAGLHGQLGPPLRQLEGEIARCLRGCGDALVGRRDPPPLQPVEAAFDRFAEALAAVRDAGATRILTTEAVERTFTLSFALEQIRQNLRDLGRCVHESRSAS